MLERQRAGLEAANEKLARTAEDLRQRSAALEASEEGLRQENANLLLQVGAGVGSRRGCWWVGGVALPD